MYERFRNPHRLCREYALEDGRKARDTAAALVGKRKYAEARSRLEEGRACFQWAGDAESELRELQRVLDELEVRYRGQSFEGRAWVRVFVERDKFADKFPDESGSGRSQTVLAFFWVLVAMTI